MKILFHSIKTKKSNYHDLNHLLPSTQCLKNYLKSKPGKYLMSSNVSILDDFKNAWATITYNSSPGVASSIEGVPAFITDPDPRISQAYDVGNYDLSKIESPELKERQYWVEKLSMHFLDHSIVIRNIKIKFFSSV